MGEVVVLQEARAALKLLMSAIDNEEGERGDRRDAPAGVSSRMHNSRMQLRRARVSGYITVKAAAQVLAPAPVYRRGVQPCARGGENLTPSALPKADVVNGRGPAWFLPD
ncbi:hypothetical protein MRX96_058254 [Rhipicephalus microplus]